MLVRAAYSCVVACRQHSASKSVVATMSARSVAPGAWLMRTAAAQQTTAHALAALSGVIRRRAPDRHTQFKRRDNPKGIKAEYETFCTQSLRLRADCEGSAIHCIRPYAALSNTSFNFDETNEILRTNHQSWGSGVCSARGCNRIRRQKAMLSAHPAKC